MEFAALQPPRRLLFTPGPTMVEPAVYEVLSKPVVSPLDPYFFEVAGQVRAMLRPLFGTSNDLTFTIPGTGSSGMETAVVNFVEPNSTLAVFSNGYFADRLSEMGRRQGARVVRLEKPWGEVFGYDEAAEFVRREKPQVVAFVHAETSTGAVQDPLPITRAARDADALVIADAVTSLGAMPICVDQTGIDIAYSCSQKGLSCPPGLAPFTASPRAVERLRARKTTVPAWYLDLRLLSEYWDGRKYHHTASASLQYALHEGLRLIHAEGLENRFTRHLRAHQALLRGLEALGLRMHVAEKHRIPHLNTVLVPAGVDDAKVRATLREKDAIEIAGGLGQLAGRIFRIGVMGPLANEDCVRMFLDKFAAALRA
ncbi:MAG TPA: alanine--glyoxylate aminotransferase family protein [Bryobacteraceae bacterium]|nr:alanine--glyoxylate aminotransferase family protein [Bryobacteraceae bacterium]